MSLGSTWRFLNLGGSDFVNAIEIMTEHTMPAITNVVFFMNKIFLAKRRRSKKGEKRISFFSIPEYS